MHTQTQTIQLVCLSGQHPNLVPSHPPINFLVGIGGLILEGKYLILISLINNNEANIIKDKITSSDISIYI